MRLVVLDFETYYSTTYSLTKMQTDAYVADPQFHAQLCGIKVDHDPVYVLKSDEIGHGLRALKLHECAVVCHHAQFDGYILAHRYGIRPKFWFDTLSMCRGLLGDVVKSASLGELAKAYGLRDKMSNRLDDVKGCRILTPKQESWLAEYCAVDVELTHRLFWLLRAGRMPGAQLWPYPVEELKLIDWTIRMFTEPQLTLDTIRLGSHRANLAVAADKALAAAGVPKSDLMSNAKFALVLQSLGVDPPMKVSPTTKKTTFAFAKQDKEFVALLEHEDPMVQQVVAARLKTKSTLEATRTERMIAMGERTPRAPIYLKYYGAHTTGRKSGGDKSNWQNLTRGSELRASVIAPPGKVIVVVDSANIEARVLNCLAGQYDMMQVFRDADAKIGPDVYCVMAESIYERRVKKGVDIDERQVGKTAVLGLGFGMGKVKFRDAVRSQTKIILSEEMAEKVVKVYRKRHDKVVELWAQCGRALELIHAGVHGAIGVGTVLTTCEHGIILPNRMLIKYPRLDRVPNPERPDQPRWAYTTGRGEVVDIYGGKVVENIVQALARIIVMEQTMRVSARLGVHAALSVHDEGVWVVDAAAASDAAGIAVEEFSKSPVWMPGIPLSAEAGFAHSYADAK